MRVFLLDSRKVMTSNDLRRLWLGLSGWTKLYLVACGSGSADLEHIARRLLKVPDEFSAYLKEFYPNADEFKKLLKEHVVVTLEMAECIRKGGCDCQEKLLARWEACALETSEWCSGTNPYWRKRTWLSAMLELFRLTDRMIRLYFSNDTRAYLECFDALDNQALQLSDITAEGIVEHFNIVH